ncbi:MAG: CoA transferase [Pseudomonadota bacterium]
MTDNRTNPNARILQGLTVLDFTRVMAGPLCTRLMADLGARVIKIERPGEGDEMRRAPAPLPGEGDHSTYFARRNAGKQSVAINLAADAGRALALDLVARSDIVVENFAPGVMTRLGCDYAACRAVNPSVLYCSISGYGQTGPDARQGAFAHVVAASSGVMHLDAGDLEPRTSHLQAADALAGAYGFGALMAALWRRERTGEGAQIDVSMLEAMLSGEDLAFGTVPNGVPAEPGPRAGMGLSPVHGRWVAWQSGGSPALFPRLCEAMGAPEMQHDPRFATGPDRRDNWALLQELVSAWLATFVDVDAALAALRAARIPCALLRTPDEVVNSAQLQHREAFVPVSHGDHGDVLVTTSPYRIDGLPVLPSGPAPYAIGADTQAVLHDLAGLDDAAIRALEDSGAIVRGDS